MLVIKQGPIAQGGRMGGIVDLPDEQAEAAIARGFATAVHVEAAKPSKQQKAAASTSDTPA